MYDEDLSPAFVARARRATERATFTAGSFLDAPLPAEQDAVLAAGEVLAYRLDPRLDRDALGVVLARCAGALRPGGILLFDLPAPDRGDAGRRHWTEGDGWAVLVDRQVADGVLTRRIVTFRAAEGERYRRGAEVHELLLFEPAEVLAALERAGLRGEVLAGGYRGLAPSPGLVVYLAER